MAVLVDPVVWLLSTPWTRHDAYLPGIHEVDDVDHWLSSPRREELFGPIGVTARTFKDPQGSKRVGLIMDIPDLAAFQGLLQTEAGTDAMKHDGVTPRRLKLRWCR